MSNDHDLARLSAKLDVIIGLLLKARADTGTEKETILYLQAAGMRTEEIARALGKTSNSIYLTLSRNRRKQRAVD